MYGLPPAINKAGHVYLIAEQADQDEILKAKGFERKSRFGLGLIILGFILQMCANLSQLYK